MFRILSHSSQHMLLAKAVLFFNQIFCVFIIVYFMFMENVNKFVSINIDLKLLVIFMFFPYTQRAFPQPVGE